MSEFSDGPSPHGPNPPSGTPGIPERDALDPARDVTPTSHALVVRSTSPVMVRRPASDMPAVRPWRILLIPPSEGEVAGAIRASRWQRRLVVIALVGAVGVATATMFMRDAPADVLAPSAELAAMRGRLGSVQDSLSQTRQALAIAEDINVGPRANRNLTSEERQRILSEMGAPMLAGLSSDGLPVTGTLTSEFSNARRHPLLHIIRPHLGLDITAPVGSRISAPAVGRVSFVGWTLTLGLLIEIEHADGVLTRYAHCRTAMVRVGERVMRGAMIGTVGSSGLTTGPHLHYEVWRRGNAIDPLRFQFPLGADVPPAPGARGGASLPVAGATSTRDN